MSLQVLLHYIVHKRLTSLAQPFSKVWKLPSRTCLYVGLGVCLPAKIVCFVCLSLPFTDPPCVHCRKEN